jgi:Integral membrane protein possibly involved in chromosome condensation
MDQCGRVPSGWSSRCALRFCTSPGCCLNNHIQFIDGIGKTAYTLSLSFASVSFGVRLALTIAPCFPTIPAPNRAVRYTLTTLAILTYAAAFPIYFGLPVGFRHKVTIALLLAYPGTLTRYFLSVRLNPLMKSFPLGTFVANAFGTALLGTFHILQSTLHPPSPNMCAVLQGLSDGYCGCLTTVSTFAVEVGALKGWEGFRYTLASWTVGQVLLLAILGPSFWHGHVKEQVTCKFDH